MSTKRYATTYAELIDRTLQNKRFLTRKFLIRFIVLTWFCLSCFVLVSDQRSGRLTSFDELEFVLAKIAALGVICGVSMLLVWAFARKK